MATVWSAWTPSARHRILAWALPRLIERKLASGLGASHRLRDFADVLE
jgi:hypothetical protein